MSRRPSDVNNINVVKLRQLTKEKYGTMSDLAKSIGKSESFFTRTINHGIMENCAFEVVCNRLGVEKDELINTRQEDDFEVPIELKILAELWDLKDLVKYLISMWEGDEE